MSDYPSYAEYRRQRRRQRWHNLGQAAFWTLVVGGLGAGGWFIGHQYWHNSALGIFAGLAVACGVGLLTDADSREVMATAAASFVLGVLAIYVMVLLTQLPMLALHLIPFDAHAYFVSPIYGALVGVGAAVLLSLKGAFTKASEATHPERVDLRKQFLMGVSFRTALAFLIASMFVIPSDNVRATIALGVLFGVVSAAAQAAFAVLLDRVPLHKAWARIALVEILLCVGLITGLLSGILDHSRLWLTLELVPAGAVACAATFGLLDLTARAATAMRCRLSTGAESALAEAELPASDRTH